jgi:hypothetical protein
MFGDLLGNVQQKQEEIRKKLSTILVEAEVGDGAVRVTANATRQILDISIDKTKLDYGDLEQVQDLLLAAVNRALELASEKEKAETQRLLQELLPPGLGNLPGFFE